MIAHDLTPNGFRDSDGMRVSLLRFDEAAAVRVSENSTILAFEDSDSLLIPARIEAVPGQVSAEGIVRLSVGGLGALTARHLGHAPDLAISQVVITIEKLS